MVSDESHRFEGEQYLPLKPCGLVRKGWLLTLEMVLELAPGLVSANESATQYAIIMRRAER